MADYKLLIPLDGSRLAEHALSFLPVFAGLGELKVTLLSVVFYPDGVRPLVPEEDQAREENLLTSYVNEVARDIREQLQASVEPVVETGEASDLILETAARLQPDLLIISTHGRSGLARFWRGSVADKVIRGATCPVLAIGPQVAEPGRWPQAPAAAPFRQVLVPLDGSEAAEKALPVAVDLAGRFGAGLHLQRVMPYVPLATSFVETPERIFQGILNAGEEYLQGVVGVLGLSEAPVTNVQVGSPIPVIRDYIEANGIDLVVMTSHGRGGISRAALGSVTDGLIGFGPPVLVLRA